ncbi:putative phage abortive infection protein [Pseudomonas soli]|uniref:Phage abortive infection protein n=1 Tax=Pseudomonas soli TaxID=1306993 RepID=A0AAJ5MQ89_9PSED|nr:putative phage abortive infection protein [Pseudomonas soli]MDW9405003.1 hypothetical protein [Pseudomonas soli]UXZ46907.1 hypothetical protein K7K07_07880 [Pseudomonas soli]
MEFLKRITFYYWLESLVKPGESVNIKPLHDLLVFAISFVALTFFVDIYLSNSQDSGHGEFGDFFGGVVNPVLTFLTFMGLLMTIVIQRVELKETRDELKRSADALTDQAVRAGRKNFEDVFLRLLDRLSAISSKLSQKTGETIIRQDYFSRVLNELNHGFMGIEREEDGEQEAQGHITQAWGDMWDRYSQDLSSYFSLLFVILDYVDGEGFNEDPYRSLIKSSFSPDELVLIYYYCVSHRYFNKYLDSANSFDLFKDLDINRLYIPEHHLLRSRVITSE